MISVVIPIYKNKESLINNLKHNLPFMTECEIILVNDDPTFSIKEDVPPGDITLIENKKNLGFAGAADVGIKQANNRYVMLLNSDVLLHNTSYLTALSTIRNDHALFAIGFSQQEKNNAIVGKNIIYWENGFFQHKKASDVKAGMNGWAEGGACIIDKKKYYEIGGFDLLYSPSYWEDIDLSYRAWKSGYRVLFDPNVLVTHFHESTIGTFFTKEEIKTIAYRNQFMFIWKNIENKTLLLSHINRTIRLLPVAFRKDQPLVKGFFKALLLLPKIIAKRKSYKISDQKILNIFK